MSDIGIPLQNLGENTGNNSQNVSITQDVKKVNTKVPKYLQKQVQDILQETRDKKDLEIKIEQIFIALENMYPNFNRNNFTIANAMLGEQYNIYCLYSKKGNLLSYIKSNGETILDMKNFKPFKDSFDKSFKNAVGINYIKKDNGKWYLLLTNDDGKIKEYIEGSERFNIAVTPD